MGASNFASNENARKIYAVLTNRKEKYSECECGKFYEWDEFYKEETETLCTTCGSDVEHDTEYRSVEDFEEDNLDNDIDTALNELPYTYLDYDLEDYSNSYNSTAFGMLSKSKRYGDIEVEVSIVPMRTSAYYEGATLDYKIFVSNGCDDVEVLGNSRYNSNVSDVLQELFDEYNSDMPVGMLKIQSKYAENWVNNTIEEMRSEVEKVFETFTEHKLRRVGGMSDGTSVYETIE